MKTIFVKTLAVAGLCTVLVSAGTGAFAQDPAFDHGPGSGHHHPIRHARHHIERLQEAYARHIAEGDREGAERVHQKARALRHKIRAIRQHREDGQL